MFFIDKLFIYLSSAVWLAKVEFTIAIHTYIQSYIQIYIKSHIQSYIKSYIKPYTHKVIHTYIHTIIHTYSHTYASACLRAPVCVLACVRVCATSNWSRVLHVLPDEKQVSLISVLDDSVFSCSISLLRPIKKYILNAGYVFCCIVYRGLSINKRGLAHCRKFLNMYSCSLTMLWYLIV